MVSEVKKKKDREYSRQWRKNNPEKIKAYLKRTKDKRREKAKEYNEKTKDKRKIYDREYYEQNREARIKSQHEIKKRSGWAYEKTADRKLRASIREKTRRKYPLEGANCVECEKPAKHRHHTTEPMEVDRFLFLCTKHHNDIHGREGVA